MTFNFMNGICMILMPATDMGIMQSKSDTLVRLIGGFPKQLDIIEHST
jgi:hypothetical protein